MLGIIQRLKHKPQSTTCVAQEWLQSNTTSWPSAWRNNQVFSTLTKANRVMTIWMFRGFLDFWSIRQALPHRRFWSKKTMSRFYRRVTDRASSARSSALRRHNGRSWSLYHVELYNHCLKSHIETFWEPVQQSCMSIMRMLLHSGTANYNNLNRKILRHKSLWTRLPGSGMDEIDAQDEPVQWLLSL